MNNENEIREKIHLATLELLGAAEILTGAHSSLVMRRFNEAKLLLRRLSEVALEASNLIPEEEGE